MTGPLVYDEKYQNASSNHLKENIMFFLLKFTF